MLPTYVVHCMEGRARLRHPALGEIAVRAAAQSALGKEQGVDEVRPGSESLLLLLQPGVDVAGICARLEARVPALARPMAEVAAERRAAARARRCEKWRGGAGASAADAPRAAAGRQGDKRNMLDAQKTFIEIMAEILAHYGTENLEDGGPVIAHDTLGLLTGNLLRDTLWGRL